MANRDPETMADLAELLAHGYDNESDDHNWMMAQSIYDCVVEPLRAENERLGVLLDLIDSRTGWTMLGRIEKRLNALTSALNRASKLTKARRWLRRKLHPDAEPLYSEAMTNMAGAVAEAATHAVVEGRFAANVHEANERLREGIRELHKPSPHDGLCVVCAAEGPANGQVDGFLEWPCPTFRLLTDSEHQSVPVIESDGGNS